MPLNDTHDSVKGYAVIQRNALYLADLTPLRYGVLMITAYSVFPAQYSVDNRGYDLLPMRHYVASTTACFSLTATHDVAKRGVHVFPRHNLINYVAVSSQFIPC